MPMCPGGAGGAHSPSPHPPGSFPRPPGPTWNAPAAEAAPSALLPSPHPARSQHTSPPQAPDRAEKDCVATAILAFCVISTLAKKLRLQKLETVLLDKMTSRLAQPARRTAPATAGGEPAGRPRRRICCHRILCQDPGASAPSAGPQPPSLVLPATELMLFLSAEEYLMDSSTANHVVPSDTAQKLTSTFFKACSSWRGSKDVVTATAAFINLG